MKRLVLAILALVVAASVGLYFLGPPRNSGTSYVDATATEVVADDDRLQAPSTNSQDPSSSEMGKQAEEGTEPGQQLPESVPADEVRESERGREPADSQDLAEVSPEKVSTAPSFDVVRVENSGRLVAAGRAEPGALVELRSGEELIDKVEADARGEWVMLPDAALSAGDHELMLVARNAGAERIADNRGSGTVIVSVQRQTAELETSTDGFDKEGAPQEDREALSAAEAPPSEPLAVLLSDDPEEAPRVLQGPREGLTSGDLSLEALSYDHEGRLTIDGRVVPSGRVFVYVDNAFFGDAVGDAEGRWRSKPEQLVSEGLHQLRLDQVDEAGTVLARLETPFVRSNFVGGLGEDGHFVVVQPGNSLWRIARGTYGRGIEYTLIFDANRDQIGDPDLIYPGQIFLLPERG